MQTIDLIIAIKHAIVALDRAAHIAELEGCHG
jgi:hypothetical protein